MPHDPSAKSSASLLSIQIGEAKPSPGSTTGVTSIDKRPVRTAEITATGLTGDTISDTKNHGGLDQAVYMYTAEDYAHWEHELGNTLAHGSFGENLTVAGLSSQDVRVGDRFRIGSVELEATSARIACGTFQRHLGLEGWVARFRDANRPGIYCRVLHGGTVETNADITHLPATDTIAILETQHLYYDTNASADRLRKALDAPVASRTRALFERRLEKALES